jgi:hypothetical protein
MVAGKYIVFVFYTGGFNRQGFSFAVDLAIRKKVDLILVTKSLIPDQPKVSAFSSASFQSLNEDEIYLQVLDLKGYYLAVTGKWKGGFPVNTENRFVTGELKDELSALLKDLEIPDLVISINANRDQLKLLAELDGLLLDRHNNLWIFYKDGLLRKKKFSGSQIHNDQAVKSLMDKDGFIINDTFLN